MKKLENQQLEMVSGGGEKGRNASYHAGVWCTAAVFLAFTPVAPLALASGYGCIISGIGIALGY